MDALWDFFFESGFIYPSKYEFIQKNKSNYVNFLILLNGCPFFFRNLIQITFWNLLPQGIKQNFKNIHESELQTLIGRTTPLIIKILKE